MRKRYEHQHSSIKRSRRCANWRQGCDLAALTENPYCGACQKGRLQQTIAAKIDLAAIARNRERIPVWGNLEVLHWQINNIEEVYENRKKLLLRLKQDGYGIRIKT
jgi:hypothetical protein